MVNYVEPRLSLLPPTIISQKSKDKPQDKTTQMNQPLKKKKNQ